MTGTDPTRIAELIQWLVNGAPGAPGPRSW